MYRGTGPLRGISTIRDGVQRKRESSWDRTGGNEDYRSIGPGSTLAIADLKGPGCITHIWITVSAPLDPYHLRNIVLRIFWDNETEASVETPLGDFFGCCHSIYRNFVSLPLAASPQDGRALNCFFPMPFARGARIEVENQSDKEVKCFFYYIDYEQCNHPTENAGYFHAWWNREMTEWDGSEDGINLDGKENYLILDAEGKGHYAGCVMGIDNRTPMWYGEGDDMIFVDGEELPPSLHGTGTEDYFNTAWCPRQEYNSPYHGTILVSNLESSRQPWEKDDWSANSWLGKYSMYRFHIEDPIIFNKSLRLTIEHGHANELANDYSSVAYWYQFEPHKRFPQLPPAEQRIPLPAVSFSEIHEWKRVYDLHKGKKS